MNVLLQSQCSWSNGTNKTAKHNGINFIRKMHLLTPKTYEIAPIEIHINVKCTKTRNFVFNKNKYFLDAQNILTYWRRVSLHKTLNQSASLNERSLNVLTVSGAIAGQGGTQSWQPNVLITIWCNQLQMVKMVVSKWVILKGWNPDHQGSWTLTLHCTQWLTIIWL